MDNARFVLFAFFIFLSIMLWQQWQMDYGPKPPTEASDILPGDTAQTDLPSASSAAQGIPHQRIHATTDVLRLEIDSEGGDIRQLTLTGYPVSKDQPDNPVILFTDNGESTFTAQSGFFGDEATNPTHHIAWRAEATEYTLQPGQKEVRIPLTWSNGQGITVTKTYVLKRDDFTIHLEHKVTNQSTLVWSGRQYFQLQRKDPGDKAKDQFVRTYTGGVLYTPEKKYEKISFKDMAGENLDRTSKDGWIAMIQHYFLAAWIPSTGEEHHFYTKSLSDHHFVIGAYTPLLKIAPGSEKTLHAQLFTGPKLLRVLEATAPGLDLTVDYGALTIIAKPIFWMLELFHKMFSNWGWAIIFVTILLKLLFFPLSAASYRSMANMRKLQPQLAELKEKYAGDKQKMNMEMMEMYRREKVNPLGGCLPILVQIPVFISLYWVLVETVEMRQAPFVFWINDLSSKDPWFILPAVMGVSMFIQQKLSPPPADPMQAKIMQFFPIMFTGFFAFFPSGLVLYWVVNNLLSIVQQWYINKVIGGAPSTTVAKA